MNKQHDLTKIAELVELVDTYETATDAKTRYQAEGQICRLTARESRTAMVYGKQGMYIASVESDGKHRIPHLQKVLSQDDLASIASKHNVEHPDSAFYIRSMEFVPGVVVNPYDDLAGRLVGVRKE